MFVVFLGMCQIIGNYLLIVCHAFWLLPSICSMSVVFSVFGKYLSNPFVCFLNLRIIFYKIDETNDEVKGRV